MILGFAEKMASTSVKFSYKSALNPRARMAPVMSEPHRENVAICADGVIP